MCRFVRQNIADGIPLICYHSFKCNDSHVNTMHTSIYIPITPNQYRTQTWGGVSRNKIWNTVRSVWIQERATPHTYAVEILNFYTKISQKVLLLEVMIFSLLADFKDIFEKNLITFN